MALFRRNQRYEDPYEEEYPAEDEPQAYDDGLDDPPEEEEVPELTEEERRVIRRDRFRIAAGAGNLVAVIGGAVLILVLLTLVFSMVSFVMNDMRHNFSLFQTNF